MKKLIRVIIFLMLVTPVYADSYNPYEVGGITYYEVDCDNLGTYADIEGKVSCVELYDTYCKDDDICQENLDMDLYNK